MVNSLQILFMKLFMSDVYCETPVQFIESFVLTCYCVIHHCKSQEYCIILEIFGFIVINL